MFTIATYHGESKSLFYLMNGYAPPDEQPCIIFDFRERANAVGAKEVFDNARIAAFRTAPTEYGMFDVRKRVETFHAEVCQRGYVLSLGTFSDSQLEAEAEKYGLMEAYC